MEACKSEARETLMAGITLEDVQQTIAGCETMIDHLANGNWPPGEFARRQDEAWFWRNEWVRAIRLHKAMEAEVDRMCRVPDRAYKPKQPKARVRSVGFPSGASWKVSG